MRTPDAANQTVGGAMKLNLEAGDLERLVAKQLSNLFFASDEELPLLRSGLSSALAKCAHCFAKSKNKYYRKDGEVYFNAYHSGQYAIFLYFLARSVYESDRKSNLPDRLYFLNKCLNGLDLFYEVDMPSVFFLDHPVGSVIGRAVFGDYFSFSQGCTVGNNKGKYPVLGRNVRMLSGSKILGQCHVGDNVVLSANAYIKDQDIPDCSIVYGSHPSISVVAKPREYFRSYD